MYIYVSIASTSVRQMDVVASMEGGGQPHRKNSMIYHDMPYLALRCKTARYDLRRLLY